MKNKRNIPGPDVIPVPEFTPVPLLRARHDGWTLQRQSDFIVALVSTGSVEAASQMVSMSRKSAYQLRNRPDARSFAAAWDEAIELGRLRVFDYLLDRALNGVTTITVKMGGAIELSHGLDAQLVATHFRRPLPVRKAKTIAKGNIR
jgi:hypothetical protein